jgi:hypothetical protein
MIFQRTSRIAPILLPAVMPPFLDAAATDSRVDKENLDRYRIV